jgi:NhaP-type Na+/H+ or K+/H+ antiporter
VHAPVILAFGLTLMAAVLLSQRAHRTVLSTSVMFLTVGFALGPGLLGWVRLDPGGRIVGEFAELALFTILFVDGTELQVRELARAWKLPGRALLIGMPLTIAAIGAAARLVLGYSWTESLLVGAILSPTDPVFVSAILEREAVPLRLRRLLSVESGLNDGMALPAVLVLLQLARHGALHVGRSLLEATGGIAIGLAAPAVFLWLESRRLFGAVGAYQPLAGVAIAGVVFGLARITGANEFLAAFAAGVGLGSLRPDLAKELRQVGAPLAEATKLATLFVFGSSLTLAALVAPGLRGLGFAALTLLAARPVSLVFAFIGGSLTRKEWLAAAWFGPKGFASLLYALLMLHAAIANATALFQAVALVIIVSILAHSSTDVPVARVFQREESS